MASFAYSYWIKSPAGWTQVSPAVYAAQLSAARHFGCAATAAVVERRTTTEREPSAKARFPSSPQ